ncbi:hypothetical protein ACVWWG_005706 [Bradyrhizobium sp. LB7.2]
MTNSSIPPNRIPVIVGIGEIVDRPKEITDGLEPLDLLEQALRRAEQDAGAKLLGEVQSLDVVNFLSWRLSRSGAAAGETTRHHAGALLLRPGRRREPDPLRPRGSKAHRARRMHGGRGLRRGGAVDRDQGRARRGQAALDAVRP